MAMYWGNALLRFFELHDAGYDEWSEEVQIVGGVMDMAGVDLFEVEIGRDEEE